MADALIPALECPHTHFDLKLTSGHGYEVHCPDCGIRGESSPIAGTAMQSFEKRVRRMRTIERRALNKALGA